MLRTLHSLFSNFHSFCFSFISRLHCKLFLYFYFLQVKQKNVENARLHNTYGGRVGGPFGELGGGGIVWCWVAKNGWKGEWRVG